MGQNTSEQLVVHRLPDLLRSAESTHVCCGSLSATERDARRRQVLLSNRTPTRHAERVRWGMVAVLTNKENDHAGRRSLSRPLTQARPSEREEAARRQGA